MNLETFACVAYYVKLAKNNFNCYLIAFVEEENEMLYVDFLF